MVVVFRPLNGASVSSTWLPFSGSQTIGLEEGSVHLSYWTRASASMSGPFPDLAEDNIDTVSTTEGGLFRQWLSGYPKRTSATGEQEDANLLHTASAEPKPLNSLSFCFFH